MNYRKEKVWSVLLRLYHWSFAGSILALVVTGLYINTPWTNSMLEGSGSFPMAEIRYIHFLAAFIFSGSLVTRIYLLLFGNKNERILDFAPVTPRNMKNFISEGAFYLYLTKRAEHRSGHNAIAGTVFILLFFLAILQIISGFFMLYPENLFWQTWGFKIFGPQQYARFIHHLIMWVFILFTTIHIYMVIWNDLKNREGLISSIFTGDKFKKASN